VVVSPLQRRFFDDAASQNNFFGPAPPRRRRTTSVKTGPGNASALQAAPPGGPGQKMRVYLFVISELPRSSAPVRCLAYCTAPGASSQESHSSGESRLRQGSCESWSHCCTWSSSTRSIPSNPNSPDLVKAAPTQPCSPPVRLCLLSRPLSSAHQSSVISQGPGSQALDIGLVLASLVQPHALVVVQSFSLVVKSRAVGLVGERLAVA
jgi:hypothetical protein